MFCNLIFIDFVFLLCFKVGRHEVSQSILAKKSLYENNQQSESNAEQKINSVTKVKKETVLITKKEVVVEKRDVETRHRKDSGSGKHFVFVTRYLQVEYSPVAGGILKRNNQRLFWIFFQEPRSGKSYDYRDYCTSFF